MDIFESFFQPAMPGPQNKHHVRRGDPIGRLNNRFPYLSRDANQRVSEDQVEKELQIDDGVLSDDDGIGSGDGGE